MPKHIRNRDHRRQEDNCSHLSGFEYAKCKVNEMMPTNPNPKQTMGWVIAILFIIILALFAAHYMGYMTLPGPLANLPRKVAPASHLQYFFF